MASVWRAIQNKDANNYVIEINETCARSADVLCKRRLSPTYRAAA